MLTRRRFAKLLVAVAGVQTAILTGCSASQVENEINVVLQEATNVLAVAFPGAPWLSQLQAAITALKTAEATWQAGGAVQIVIDALNTIVAITAAIPLTEIVSPLIDILVAGIEAVLAALPAPATTLTMRAQAPNPHIGRVVIKHRWAHSRASDFKSAWNIVARSNPALAKAVIQ